MALDLPDELPEGYYLDNFVFLLEFVRDRYHSLLTQSELQLINQFFAADESAQKLYVRMANRKGEYFRKDKLSYDEIPDIDSSLSSLELLQLSERVVPDIEAALPLCRKEELQQLPLAAELGRQVRRDELVAGILETGINPVAVLSIDVVRVLGMAELQVLKLLFFGNFYQDMTEFVLGELVSPFEQYELTSETSLFQNRQVVDDLVRFRDLSDLSHDLISADETGEHLIQLLGTIGPRPTQRLSARRHDRIVNRIARQLERLGRAAEALDAYQNTRATPSRERSARLLVSMDRPEDAIRLCEEISMTPRDEDEWEFSLSFGGRMAKKHQLDFSPLSEYSINRVPQQQIEVPRLHEKVELSALAWYLGIQGPEEAQRRERVDQTESQASDSQGVQGDQDTTGWYVENTLFRSLFGLLFWDIIFAPVPGVFFHPFQRGPDDLYTEDFVENRRHLIELRLAEIESNDWCRDRIETVWSAKFGIANQFVGWRWLDRELIDTAVNRIPGEHLALVFNRMLADLKNNTNGLPDLILFEGDSYRLVEIKGPGDKLQKNQARWFRYFHEHKIPAEVVDVIYLP